MDTPFNFDTTLGPHIGEDAKSRPFLYVKYSTLSHMTYTFSYIYSTHNDYILGLCSIAIMIAIYRRVVPAIAVDH